MSEMDAYSRTVAHIELLEIVTVIWSSVDWQQAFSLDVTLNYSHARNLDAPDVRLTISD